MSKIIKILGIIALAAVIGFSMTACSSDDDDGPPPYRSFITVSGIQSAYNGKIGTLVLSSPENSELAVYSTEEIINVDSTTFPLLNWADEYPWDGRGTFNITILIFNDRAAAKNGTYIYAGVAHDVEVAEETTSVSWSDFSSRPPNANILQAYFQKR